MEADREADLNGKIKTATWLKLNRATFTLSTFQSLYFLTSTQVEKSFLVSVFPLSKEWKYLCTTSAVQTGHK